MATYQAVIDIEANNLQQAIDAFYHKYGYGGYGYNEYLEASNISFQEKGE